LFEVTAYKGIRRASGVNCHQEEAVKKKKEPNKFAWL
jgi:hypothetical protein